MHEPEKSDSVVVAEKPTKGGDQGERGPAKHAPSAGPGKCVTGAGTLTASCTAREKGEVHFALAPRRPRHVHYGLHSADSSEGRHPSRDTCQSLTGARAPG